MNNQPNKEHELPVALNPDCEAARLFKTFARFEYALKAAGFHRGDGDAQPDWTTFAESIAKDCDSLNDSAFHTARTYFATRPPKKQIVRNGVLEWAEKPVSGNSEADPILLYVRRVRNNLFHGGKFNGRWFEPQRSAEFIRHSVAILDACRDLSADVRVAFEQE